MKLIYLSLLVTVLLPLSGYGANSQTAATAVEAKKLTPTEQFAETKKKAEAGDVEAQNNLGVMYRDGNGVPKNSAKAVEWNQKAAAQGDEYAQLNLCQMYSQGEGVSKNMARAYAWCNLAAVRNDAAKTLRNNFESTLTRAELAEGQRLASNWKEGDTLMPSSRNSSGSTISNDKPKK